MNVAAHAFELPAELTIYTAAETRQALLKWVLDQNEQAATHLQLLAHSVDEVDGAGVQLLGALANTVASLGIQLQCLDPSPVLVEVAGALGCGGWIEALGGNAPALTAGSAA